MEKKPVYESPKVSRLDEKESVLGQGAFCSVGSGNSSLGCTLGNAASAGRGCDQGIGVIN